MNQYFYLLCLLLYINASICYDYYEQDHSHRNSYNHRKSGRFRRKRVERRRADFGYDYDYKSPVQQFDVASFVQRSADDALGDDEGPTDYRVNKRRTTDNYDYDNLSNNFNKKQNFENTASDDIFELKDNPTYPKGNSEPKLDFNHFGTEDLEFDNSGHSKIRNVYNDDGSIVNDNRKPKKSFFKRVKLPFFSHRQSAEVNSKKEKKRKLFCINCQKNDINDGEKGTNSESTDGMTKKDSMKRKRSHKDSFNKQTFRDYSSDVAHDQLSKRRSHKGFYGAGLISDENRKKESELSKAKNTSHDAKHLAALNKPLSKNDEFNNLGPDEVNIGSAVSSKVMNKEETSLNHKHKKFSLKNMKFPFLFNKQSHRNQAMFDVANVIQDSGEAFEYSEPYEYYSNKRSDSSNNVDYVNGMSGNSNDNIQLYSNTLDSMKVPFFSHDQSPTLNAKETFEKTPNGGSNEIEKRPSIRKAKRSAKEYSCPICKKRFMNDNDEESDSSNTDQESYRLLNKRSYEEKVCPACMKSYTDTLTNNGKQKENEIIHNSRQFYQTFDEFDNSTLENQVITEPENAVNTNSREKRDETDRERQLQELEAVEKKIQAVQVNIPKFNKATSGL